MGFPRIRYIVASLAIIIVLAMILIPAVPYRISIDNPGFPYRMEAYQTCASKFGNTINDTNREAWDQCLAQYLIPPINVTGYGSLSFRLLGIGTRPFPGLLSVGEPDFYALLHMSGGAIAAAEEIPQEGVVYNPPGITISDASISRGYLGFSNVTVTVSNQSGQTLISPWLFVSVPGSSGNFTDKNGVTWIFTPVNPSGTLAYDGCFQNGYPSNLGSGASCTTTFHPIISAPFGSSFRYSIEVRGQLGSKYSITKQTFLYSLSAEAANRLWVGTFVNLVNAARNNSPLVESASLSQFANLRFNTAVIHPDISDYGLYSDETSFLGTNSTKTVVEILLYPSIPTEDPMTYASLIQRSAPGHWSALTDRNYTHFGYYVGTGPYEVVQQPCPIFEIPRAGINITQYFENAGCKVTVEQSTWLVLILSN